MVASNLSILYMNVLFNLNNTFIYIICTYYIRICCGRWIRYIIAGCQLSGRAAPQYNLWHLRFPSSGRISLSRLRQTHFLAMFLKIASTSSAIPERDTQDTDTGSARRHRGPGKLRAHLHMIHNQHGNPILAAKLNGFDNLTLYVCM